MTLRLRLTLAIVVLVACGLAMLGVATYSIFARQAYDRLDSQLKSYESLIDQQLDVAGGRGGSSFGGGSSQSGPGGPAPIFVPPGTYAERRDTNGDVLSHLILPGSRATPELPAVLPAPAPGGTLFDVGSSSGSGRYRVLVTSAGSPGGGMNVIAVPLTEVTNSLHRLTLIETGGAVILLVLLSAGSWLILRRGLRPLERMAGTASSISSGDLSQRVSPSGGPTEVGQLGLALNTMLDEIEVAFQEREATEVRLRQFLSDASHELRTPLTSIQGFAELYRVGGEDARVDLPTILRRIEEESARMKVLVESLLLLARLDEHRATEHVPVDLAVLAADACSDAAAIAPDRTVTLDAPEPVVVAGDEAYLRQAIANLVTNAIRHTPAGTPIDVGAHVADGAAMVSVRDHGPGLSHEALAHVFDRFWQADSARVGASAGLGLAIVSSIAADHGGAASVENAPGGGALFTVRLPLNPVKPAEALSTTV